MTLILGYYCGIKDNDMELVLASALIFMMFCIGYILVDYWKHWR
jgi:hypothetical protein